MNKEDMAKEIKDKIDSSINDIHRSTYVTEPEVSGSFDNLSQDMDLAVDRLISRTRSRNGNNISQLYARHGTNTSGIGAEDLGSGIENIFGNPENMEGIMSSYMENLYIREFDMEIDTICNYMPSLVESLEVKRDAVLSADVFNKDFMTVSNLSKEDQEDEGKLSAEMNTLEEIYKIEDMIDTAYMNTSKYGEQFIYNISYKKAFATILDAMKSKYRGDQSNAIDVSDIALGETVISINESSVSVSGDIENDVVVNSKINNVKVDDDIDLGDFNIDITLSKNGYIANSILQDRKFRKYIKDQEHGDAILESVISETHNFYNNDIAYMDRERTSLNDISQDGLINGVITQEEDINVLGCVVRRLKRENVIPIYIDDVCLGYYYIENTDDNIFEQLQNVRDPMSNLNNRKALSMDTEQRKQMIKRISKTISDTIDANFINANADISNEIYTLLKYNYIYGDEYGHGLNHIKITFIPPDDMIHFYFEKDPVTHRGISDLQKSLFPAKLYAALYITNTLGILTRSQDKRAYFVKQTVDTNISKLLMNTISQIKKSNFGLREVSNLNNIFNITGRFNDYIVPVSQSGERPIDFEIIPGQDIDENPDLMDRLETMAINPLGVPLELLDVSRSIEFARQITTSNGKFARNVLKRQKIVERFISELVTKIYNYHYNANADLESTLSPPSYLTISNTSELLSNATDMVNSLIEIEVPDDQMNEPWVSSFKRELMKHHLSSYIDWDEMERMKKRAKIESVMNNDEEQI